MPEKFGCQINRFSAIFLQLVASRNASISSLAFLGTHWQPDRQQDLLGVSQRARRVSRERIQVEVLHRNTPKTALDEALEALAKNGMVLFRNEANRKRKKCRIRSRRINNAGDIPRRKRTVTKCLTVVKLPWTSRFHIAKRGELFIEIQKENKI
jgi:hypothetical protein